MPKSSLERARQMESAGSRVMASSIAVRNCGNVANCKGSSLSPAAMLSGGGKTMVSQAQFMSGTAFEVQLNGAPLRE